MALPYVTARQAEKIAKKVVEEQGSSPAPTPTPSGFDLNERFFEMTASINFDKIDAASFGEIINNYIVEMPNYFFAGTGFSTHTAIVDSIPGDNPIYNEVFYFNLAEGSINSENQYTCVGYKLSDLISYIKNEISLAELDKYNCYISNEVDVETGESWLVIQAVLIPQV